MSDSGPAPRRIGIFSISRSLQGLAIAVLLLIVGATAGQLLAIRSAIISDTKRQMSRLDMVFAEQTGRAVETVDFILRNAIETLQNLQVAPPVDARAYDELLRRRIGAKGRSDMSNYRILTISHRENKILRWERFRRLS